MNKLLNFLKYFVRESMNRWIGNKMQFLVKILYLKQLATYKVNDHRHLFLQFSNINHFFKTN